MLTPTADSLLPSRFRPHRFGVKTRAFSLVEVVMAIGIASFSLLATVGLLASGYSMASDAINHSNMTAIASRAFAQVTEELRAGNDPSTALKSYEERFNAEGLPLSVAENQDQWAYRSSLKFSTIPVGSKSENKFVLSAETQVESRREVKKLYQCFVFNSSQTPAP